MKTPRIDDFDPHAKKATLKSPLEGMPTIEKPLVKPSMPAQRVPNSEKSGKPENLISGNHENRKSGKPENLKTGKPDFVKAEKYCTQLQPDVIKQIKQYALEHDMKDYEVVQSAIREYINKK
jgi:hypothetical protein